MGFPGGSVGKKKKKKSACNAGDSGSIPGLGRFPGEEYGNPLQYSCWENPMDRGAWRATELDMAERLHHHHGALRCFGPWPLVGSGTLLWGSVPPSLGLRLWPGGAHRCLDLSHYHNGNWLELGPCPGYTTYHLEILGRKPDLFEPQVSHLPTGALSEGLNATARAKHTVSAQ